MEDNVKEFTTTGNRLSKKPPAQAAEAQILGTSTFIQHEEKGNDIDDMSVAVEVTEEVESELLVLSIDSQSTSSLSTVGMCNNKEP